MNLEWSPESSEDLSRLHDFLAPVNPRAAAEAVQMLVRAGLQLPGMPRIGQRVEDFGVREVRRVIVEGRYELRYEIVGERIIVLRVFHAREDR
jgi:plasmid stabilization system protein ParE